MSDGVVCRSCGTQNAPGRDFCEQCGEYLAWAPTSMMPAVPGAAGGGDEATSGDDAREGEPRAATSGAAAGEPPTTEEGDAPPAPEAEAAPGPEAASAQPPPPAGAGELPPGAVSDSSGGAPSPRPQEDLGPLPAGDAEGALAATGAAQATLEPPPTAEDPGFPDQLVGLPESPPPTGDASLVLAPIDPVIGAAGVPAVDAGSSLAFRATIRNESHIVDNYDLAVLGLPENWAVVGPAAAFLVPLGSGRGDSELELRIDIAPPREYRSTAGIWTFELVALSRTSGTLAARAIAHFEVLPFQAWTVEVVPALKVGRFRARYRTAVRNDGNAEQMLWPAAMDDTGKLRRRFTAGKLTLDAGEVGADTLTVRPRFPKIVGRVTEHRIGVDVLATEPVADEDARLATKDKLAAKAKEKAAAERKKAGASVKTGRAPKPPMFRNPLKKLRPAQAAGMLSKLRPGGDPLAPVTGTQVSFRQKPVIPFWLIALILLLAIIAILVYLLWPVKSTVPSLVNQKDAFAAEKVLHNEGLVLGQPVERRADSIADPGSVIDQTPAAGTKVDEGSSVNIVVAEGEATQVVPPLRGRTRVVADKLLRERDLVLGETQPADAPDNYVVRSQIPAAGLKVESGTAVRVFLRKPPLTPKEKAAAKKEAEAKAKADAKTKADKAKEAVVPPFKDTPLDEYEDKLEKQGLKSDVHLRISTTKAGTVLGVDPAVGEKVQKGDVVVVDASGGPAPIAIQESPVVHVVNPVGGKELYRLPAPQGSASEPSYLPGGEHVVYRSGAQIIYAEDGKDAKYQAVYTGSDALVRPTMSSNGNTLAMIRREEGDGDLCFGRLSEDQLGRLCLPDDGWNLDGRMSWRPDGKSVLVAARKRNNPSVFAVRQYQSKKAFSTNLLDWSGRTATPINKPGKGVRVMAYSPGGQRVAAITNLDTDRFEVAFAGSEDLRLVQPIATSTQACDVAWRPDGIEVTVVQADDACTESTGKLVRFRRETPKDTSPVADKGSNPAYRADQY